MTISMRFSTPITQFAQIVTLSAPIKIQKMYQQYKYKCISQAYSISTDTFEPHAVPYMALAEK
jgi:hypothetical protein